MGWFWEWRSSVEVWKRGEEDLGSVFMGAKREWWICRPDWGATSRVGGGESGAAVAGCEECGVDRCGVGRERCRGAKAQGWRLLCRAARGRG